MNLNFESLLPAEKHLDRTEPYLAISPEGEVPAELFEEETGFEFLSFSPTISNSGKVTFLKSKRAEERLKFEMNLNIWNYQTSLMTNNRFDNDYFREIVKMRETAVPFILEELRKGPTPLVHALNFIYPDMVQCDGFVPLDALCSLWKDILMGIVEP